MSTNRILLHAALLVAGCAAQAPAPQSQPQPVVLGTYEGEIDPVAGTFTIRPSGPTSTPGEAGPNLAVIADGSSTVTIANNGTPTGPVTGTGACTGQQVMSGTVRISLGYPSPGFAGGLYAENTWVSASGSEACNSDAAPAGLSTTYGLWSYGTVRPGRTTSEKTWQFKWASGQKVSFRGRIVGVPGTTFTTSLPTAASTGTRDTTIAYARDRMVYATNAAGLAYVSLAGAWQSTTALGTGENATSIATDVRGAAADDLVWFTTNSYVGVVHNGTVYKIAGGDTGLGAIAVDPTTTRRAWFLTRTGTWFRSVTFDPTATPTPTLTLGATVSTGVQPIALTFGPSPDYWIYVGSNWNVSRESWIKAWDTSGTSKGTLPGLTVNSGFGNPYQIVLGPDGKLWYGFCDLACGVCNYDLTSNPPAPKRITSDGYVPVLGVGKSVTGAGNAVWGAFEGSGATPTHRFVELVEGKTTFFTVDIVDSGAFTPSIGGSPAVSGSPSYDPFVWGTTAGGIRRLQP